MYHRHPKKTGRIKGDGNCFFRAIAEIVTGDQDDHNEMRLIVTAYMMNKSNLPKLRGIVGHESMDQYFTNIANHFEMQRFVNNFSSREGFLSHAKVCEEFIFT